MSSAQRIHRRLAQAPSSPMTDGLQITPINTDYGLGVKSDEPGKFDNTLPAANRKKPGKPIAE